MDCISQTTARPLSPPQNSKWIQNLHAAANASSADYQNRSSPVLIPPDQTAQYITEKHTTKVPRTGNRIKMQNKKSILLQLDERMPIENIINAPSSLSKPRSKRTQTDPSMTQRSKTALLDDELMTRALSIREDLRQYEMQELAAEAERAAEEGMERFVGATSKFIGDTHTPHKYFSPGGYEDDFVLDYNVERIRSRPTGGSEYTPSYFNKKKIRVTSLREFHEVVPPFERIHDNIRLHLKQRGVDERVLPEEERQMCPTTSDEDDANSQAASQTGSIASFSSFAINSIRGMMDYMGNPRKNPSISSYEKQFSTSGMSTSTKGFDSCCGSIEFQADALAKNDEAKQYYASETMSPTVDDNSDDSSVELCGRKHTLTGQLSPPSVNGMLSGVSDDKILQTRELLIDHVEDKSHTQSITSRDATKSVATFFTKMQQKFNGIPDTKKSKPRNDDDAKFISNYFYTNHQDANNVNLVGISNFKLDINPDRKRNDSFCISSGCVQNDLLPGCETVGNAMDVMYTWLNERGKECDATSASTNSRSLDTRSPPIGLHHSWIRTWQVENGVDHRFFMPPRLAMRDFKFECSEMKD